MTLNCLSSYLQNIVGDEYDKNAIQQKIDEFRSNEFKNRILDYMNEMDVTDEKEFVTNIPIVMDHMKELNKLLHIEIEEKNNDFEYMLNMISNKFTTKLYYNCGSINMPRFAKVIHKSINIKCNHCGKEETDTPFEKCGGCKMKYYCCRECQKLDWITHQGFCKGGLVDKIAYLHAMTTSNPKLK